MALKKVLITVTTYPLPSHKYYELVCTAGILEDGSWIRIYPVPLKFLKGFKKDNKIISYKYHWVEFDLEKRTDDFRPESHSPIDYTLSDLKIISKLGTKNNWHERKSYCLKKIYTNTKELIEDSKPPKYISLATFKPTKILSFKFKETDREWKDEWKELRKFGDLFDQDRSPEIPIRKLPYNFYYRFTDDQGKESTLMIEDWEIGALYWKCLERAQGNEEIALEKVREKYEKEFLTKKDIYLFLGTTKVNQIKGFHNPFIIIGVFYPPREQQLSLF